MVNCFRRKKAVKLADIKKKLKGQLEVEPTDQEWIDMLETIADIDEDFVWVSFSIFLSLVFFKY